MSEVIVRGRAVLRGIGADGGGEIVEDGAVLVSGNVIAAVDDFETLRSAHANAAVIGSKNDVIAPGFVNAHHHVGLTPFQLGAPDLPLELWLASKIGLRQVDPYLDTLYSAFELISSGVTTVQHLHVSRGPPDEIADQSKAILQAYADIGLRASYSYGYRDQNRLVYEADETFLARLPVELAKEVRPWFERQRLPVSDYIGEFERLHACCAGRSEGRIGVQLSPANLHWCSDEALVAIGDASAHHSVPMHIHLLETWRQKAYAERRFGKSAVRHLDDLGLLGPLTTLGHMVWADDDDLDRVARSGACICHNASSNLRLGSGVAPCMPALKRKIPVAIGIDEAGLNDDRDMLQELRLVLSLHRTASFDGSDAPSAGDVFRMATEHGARTTAFRGTIGRIDPGMAADLVLFDWPSISAPYLDDSVPLVDAILRRATQKAVRAVMIAGRMVFEDGRFVQIDRNRVLREISVALSKPQSEEERRRRALAAALRQYVLQMYDEPTGNR